MHKCVTVKGVITEPLAGYQEPLAGYQEHKNIMILKQTVRNYLPEDRILFNR